MEANISIFHFLKKNSWNNIILYIGTPSKARESVMDQLFNSNTTSEKNEEKRDKNGKNEEESLEEDEFDLAYKMIFTDTLRTRGDQVR